MLVARVVDELFRRRVEMFRERQLSSVNYRVPWLTSMVGLALTCSAGCYLPRASWSFGQCNDDDSSTFH